MKTMKTEKFLTGSEARKHVEAIFEEGLEYKHPEGIYISGYFFDKESWFWVAFDNREKRCYVEDFETEEQCINWLNNE